MHLRLSRPTSTPNPSPPGSGRSIQPPGSRPAARWAARPAARLEVARSIVGTAEQRLERQAQMEDDIAARKTELDSAMRADEAVAAALQAAETEADGAAEAVQAAAVELSRCEIDSRA